MSHQSYQDLKSVVLLNSFQIQKKRYRVFYNDGTLIWEREKSSNSKISISINDIISVSYPNQKNLVAAHNHQVYPVLNNIPSSSSTQINTIEVQNADNRCFSINYAKRNIDPKVQEGGNSSKTCYDANKWRVHTITLHNDDKYIVKEWHDELNKIIKTIKRPRKLLLFINPYGGKKNALHLYEKYAKPIFRMAMVDVSVIITQRPNQIIDLVMEQHLENFDGIVCCGGDGTFSELFNGLIFRKMMEKHSNLESSNSSLDNITSPNIPCGIIPAGSTDTIAYCLHGTSDLKTCIIHIVLGQTGGLDVSSVSNNKGLLKFYASVIAYGFLGDVANENDQYRFLGPKRYEYVGLKKFLLNRGYDMDLHILQEPEDINSTQDVQSNSDCDTKETKCYENCNVCLSSDAPFVSEDNEKYKRITGRFFMVNCANISCACERSKKGLSPYCHLGDGKIHLILVRHGSMWQNLKLLLKMSSRNGHISQYPFVELYKTRKVYFKALNSTSDASLADSTQPISISSNKKCSVWNCDGEVLQETDVIVRCHKQLIEVYRRGPIQENEETLASGFCCL